MFKHWAAPVVSKPWAILATITYWIARKSNFRLFPHFQHTAWERAVGVYR